MSFDLAIFDALDAIRFPFLDRVMHVITVLGDSAAVWIALAVVLLCFKKTRRYGLVVAAALLLSVLTCNLILKRLVERPRPFDALPDFGMIAVTRRPPGSSFPSGHTSSSIAAAVALWLYGRKHGLAPWMYASALVLAALISFSRVYLHLHYATDVLGGVVLGVLCAVAANAAIARLTVRKCK